MEFQGNRAPLLFANILESVRKMKGDFLHGTEGAPSVAGVSLGLASSGAQMLTNRRKATAHAMDLCEAMRARTNKDIRQKSPVHAIP